MEKAARHDQYEAVRRHQLRRLAAALDVAAAALRDLYTLDAVAGVEGDGDYVEAAVALRAATEAVQKTTARGGRPCSTP